MEELVNCMEELRNIIYRINLIRGIKVGTIELNVSAQQFHNINMYMREHEEPNNLSIEDRAQQLKASLGRSEKPSIAIIHTLEMDKNEQT
jgi:hypothetical protein